MSSHDVIPDLSNSISDQNQKLTDFIRKKEAINVAKIFSKDCMIMPPNMDPFKGNIAIQVYWEEVFKTDVDSLSLETLEIESYDKGLIEFGKYSVYIEDNVEDKGKYMTMWIEEDGEWKINRQIWNSNLEEGSTDIIGRIAKGFRRR